MFRNRNLLLNFVPENGMHVLARAQVSLYEGRGEFQLIIEHLEPAGDGRLRLAFEALKRKLHAEGLFDESRKVPLPSIPRCIGVITSPTGAAIRDILSVLRRRFPAISVVIYPALVQGSVAAATIARAIAIADERKDCDVLILARGGGSMEDLWAFNEEIVARAIYACGLPIVSGIGHEIDFTIADLVADRRAPTPSAAAELVVPDQNELLTHLALWERRLIRQMTACLERARGSLGWLTKRLVHPGRRLQDLAQRLDDLSLRMGFAFRALLERKKSKVETLDARLHRMDPLHTVRGSLTHAEHLRIRLEQAMGQVLSKSAARLTQSSRALRAVSPLATLERGYAIVTTWPVGRVVRDAASLQTGNQVMARLARGQVRCEVKEVFDETTL
jgi:exodeoxyribonuclease VII large subunit